MTKLSMPKQPHAEAKACARNFDSSLSLSSATVVLLILSAILVVSCDSGSGDIPIRNNTDQVLTVTDVFVGREPNVEVIEPGKTGRFDSAMGSAGPFQVTNRREEPLMTISALTTDGPLPFEITDDELAPNIINDANVTLTLSWVRVQGGDLELATLEPGRGHAVAGCFAELVAQTQDGTEYARYAGSMCTDDNWSITDRNI